MSDLFGQPMVLLPYDRPGCLERVQAFLLAWAWRGLLVGIGVVIGVIVE